MTHPRNLLIACLAACALSLALIPQPAVAQLPWMNTDLSAATRTELLLDARTVDQKILQMQTVPSPNEELEGCGFQALGRHVEGIPELAIPTMRQINGGNGMRGGDCAPEPAATGQGWRGNVGSGGLRDQPPGELAEFLLDRAEVGHVRHKAQSDRVRRPGRDGCERRRHPHRLGKHRDPQTRRLGLLRLTIEGLVHAQPRKRSAGRHRGECRRRETWMPVAETVTRGTTTSSFRWTVDLPAPPTARVRVRALDGSGAEGTSEAFAVTASPTTQSAHVFMGEQGRLVYVPYENGDRIPDFSFAGYRAGGVALPMVAPAVTVSPVQGDDGRSIQAAIDRVSARDPDASGFRGAVLLNAGTYEVARSLSIRASGVVLRGQGDHSQGTVIRAVGRSRRVLIDVSGVADRTEVPGTRQRIAETYVPAGAFRFSVRDASRFAVGDDVLVTRTPNQAWIDAVGMDACTTHGTAYDTSDVSGRTCLAGRGVMPWTPELRVMQYERRIASIDGNRITIDAPTVEALQKEFGGGYVVRYRFPGRIQKVGIEHLRSESDYASATDERHATRMIALASVKDAWVRNVTSRYFEQGTVVVRGGSKYVTIQDSASLDHRSRLAGGRRYPFGIERASFVLVMRSLARSGRHDFVTGANTPGPNVFLDGSGLQSRSELGPHHRWATGTLFDRVRHESVSRNEIMGVYNRGNSGTGHGWSGAYQVFWNCIGDTHRVVSPPHARNWSIGCQARRRQGDGEFESFGEPVAPPSLYLQQLRDRLGEGALANIGYSPDGRALVTVARG